MYEYNKDFWDWVTLHSNDDPSRLRLSKKKDTPWIDEAINHIENRQRSRSKFVTGNDDESALLPRLMPVAISIEQATSVAIARLHRHVARLPINARVLDMTCGLGIDASFLAADAATELTTVELDSRIASVARWNFKDRPNITVINDDSVRYLESTDKHYDLIFIDPARRDSNGSRVYNLHDCLPDVTTLLPLLKARTTRIMVKMSPMLDIRQTLCDLPGTRQLLVIEERNECRELLAIIDSDAHDDSLNATISIHNVSAGSNFSFTLQEESDAPPIVAMPRAGQYLLEPSPATMKAAPFRILCHRHAASMIHSNTHLYVSDSRPLLFPGKVYMITEVIPYSSGVLKRLSRLKLDADVAVRNFPVSAEALRQRLGIKKSGDTRIIGVTACDGKQYLLIARKSL